MMRWLTSHHLTVLPQDTPFSEECPRQEEPGISEKPMSVLSSVGKG